MYATRFVRLFSIVAAGCVLNVSALPASAQSSPTEQQQLWLNSVIEALLK